MKQAQDIPPKVMELMHRYGEKRKLKTLETLVHVGEHCNSIFFVLKGGFLKKFYNEKSEVRRTISFHLPTHRPFITIAESYFQQKPSYYEIKAFRNSEILVFKKSLSKKVLEEYDFIESFHYKKIVEVLIYESELKSRLITYNSAEFYEHLCENYPEIIQQVPSKYIAEFMRISPGWLSKLKAK